MATFYGEKRNAQTSRVNLLSNWLLIGLYLQAVWAAQAGGFLQISSLIIYNT